MHWNSGTALIQLLDSIPFHTMNQNTEAALSALYRTEIAAKASFLLKAGTKVLTKDDGSVDVLKLDDIANQAAWLHQLGKKAIIVTSGAVAAGKSELQLNGDIYDVVGRQASAAVGQHLLMAHYNNQLSKHGLLAGQILLSYADLRDPEKIRSVCRTVGMHHQYNVIPILNENDPVSPEELLPDSKQGFGDNDTLAAMAAKAFGIEVMIFYTQENGFIDYGAGKKFNVVSDIPSIRKYLKDTRLEETRGGAKSKLDATESATSNGSYVIHAKGKESNIVGRIFQGEPLGTLFLPKNYKKQ